jgi:hypothetical protein
MACSSYLVFEFVPRSMQSRPDGVERYVLDARDFATALTFDSKQYKCRSLLEIETGERTLENLRTFSDFQLSERMLGIGRQIIRERDAVSSKQPLVPGSIPIVAHLAPGNVEQPPCGVGAIEAVEPPVGHQENLLH